jgi:U1 small nuclear ribonucleoprotein C
VRRQHNDGYKHKANVRNYYLIFEEAGRPAAPPGGPMGGPMMGGPMMGGPMMGGPMGGFPRGPPGMMGHMGHMGMGPPGMMGGPPGESSTGGVGVVMGS